MDREYDPLQYIRDYYRVPAFVGRVVLYKGKRGVVTGASGPHVKAWFSDHKNDLIVHPLDLDWTDESGQLPKRARGQKNYLAWLHSETSETFIEFLRNPHWNDLRARW